jgi:hypothetical protein
MYKYIYDQVQIDEDIEITQDEELSLLSDECDIRIEDINTAVQPIIDSCTKDAIQVQTLTTFLLQ